jgi:signal transduction histidine kinase/CheY-like chemotaxis protein/HPt (histidine-containing phosphotransfer) domain-containing protein
MKQKLIFLILGAFTIGTLILVYIQYNSSKSIEGLVGGDSRLLQEFKIRKNLTLISGHVVALQRLVKGLDTGNPSRIKTRMDSLEQEISKAKEELKKSITDDSTSQYIDSLSNAVLLKAALCRKVWETHKQAGWLAADRVVEQHLSVWLSDDIEFWIKKIENTRDDHLTAITRAVDKSGTRAQKLNDLLTVLVLLAAALIFWYIIYIIQKLSRSEEKVRQGAALKEHFIANMSHEIRTPMNAILGFTALLEQRELDQTSRQYVDTIRKSGEGLLTIINDVLDLSKIEAGMMAIESAPFNIRSLIHSVEVMFTARVAEKKLQLRTRVADNVPEILEGDATRLTQILVNLVGNSLKFTREGSIEVNITNEQQAGQNANIGIEVSDTGIGIDPGKQKEIFNRFQQGDESITRDFGGTGLGLSIVNELVTLQKGTITLSSEPGKGTSFYLRIPYTIASDEQKINTQPVIEDIKASFEDWTDIRLLFVEDNEVNQSLIQHLFDNWKINYDLAGNGREAVHLLKLRAYDLVLMDIQMPQMDGYSATHYIRDTLQLSIPVIAMTAHALAGEKEKCLSCGMNDYIAKPIKAATLYQLLIKYIPVSHHHFKEPVNKKQESAYACINLDYLHEVSMGNKDYEKTVTGLFIETVPDALAAIRSAWQDGRISTVKQEAHNMKTTVSVMGLNHVLQPYLDALEYNELSQATFDTYFDQLELACDKALMEARHLYNTYSS